MLIPFGVLSAAGAGEVGGTYELIASEILTTTESSVVFSNLGDYSSTYKHLQIRYAARTSFASNGESIFMRINGDTGTNYSHHRLFGNGASVTSVNSFNTSVINVGFVASGAGSSIFGSGVVDFLDSYSTTKNKTTRSLNGIHITNSDAVVSLGSGARYNTASITSLEFLSETSSNFVAGSRFSLYGIKG
jgi:hypothetical protein